MLEAVIFDVDGTLIDSVDLHAECWKQAFEKFGKPVPFDQVRRLIGKGGDQLMPSILSQEEMKKLSEPLNEFRSALWKREFIDKVRPFAQVKELFQALRERKIQVALGSSGKTAELEQYEKLLGIEELFDVRVTSDDADNSKPEPDIFDAAMKKLTSRRELTVVIGDTPYDVRAANRAALKTIAVLCGGFPEDELRATGAVEVFRDPSDLLRRLDEWADGSTAG